MSIDPVAKLPFTAEDLLAAIALRADGAARAGPVTISIGRMPSNQELRINIGDRRRVFAVDANAPAAETLRLTALLAVDLLDSGAPPAVAQAPPASKRWTAAFGALGTPAGAWGDGRWEADLELRRHLAQRWWLIGAVGYTRVTRTVFGHALAINSVPARAGVSLDLGWGSLGAAASFRLDWTQGASGAISGGWFDLRPALIRSKAGRAALVLALELATRRLEVRPPESAAVFTTGYFTPWVGLALSSP